MKIILAAIPASDHLNPALAMGRISNQCRKSSHLRTTIKFKE